MILFTKKKNQSANKLIGFCMGEKGQFSRILGPIVKSPITYAYIDKEAAPGQLSVQDLCQTYHFPSLTPETSIYALIGSPTRQSISHKTHNAVFSQLLIPAVYLKMDIETEEINSCLDLMKKFPFQGLSITMPLKEKVFPSQSINTLALHDKKWRGKSTDGIGAVLALEELTSLENKKILLIGAGGTALTIGKELVAKTPNITIYNRTDSKAEGLAKKLSCRFVSSKKPPTNISYDILIQASSCGMDKEEMPIEENLILPHTIILECVMKNTLLIKAAEKKGCQIIPGYKLFLYQALEQFRFWFPKIPPKELFQALHNAIRLIV
jgi:3-dehydroquinate dehydratase/shikimate dehydrogenase